MCYALDFMDNFTEIVNLLDVLLTVGPQVLQFLEGKRE